MAAGEEEEGAAAAATAGEGKEAGNGGGYDGKCTFCRIARREEPGTALFPCQYEDLVCFRDIRPGAPHHFLVVPVEHMGNCKTLKAEHIPVVKRMIEVGNAVLQRNNFNDLNDVRMGFHWPPFCSISHLHLHVLAPASQLGFLSRLVYRINSYWFITKCCLRSVVSVEISNETELAPTKSPFENLSRTKAYPRCFDAAKNQSLQCSYSILVSLHSPKTKKLKKAEQLIERLQTENAAS